MRKDEFGDRMKRYESFETERLVIPLLPVLGRVDGRAFHHFTRGMKKPYDLDLIECMKETAIELVKETNAILAYCQSDEITLLWDQSSYKSEIWFGGRIFKMTSQLAAHTTLAFNHAVEKRIPQYKDRNPTFDARIWQVPNRTEAINVFIWREQDATRNSISMAAQSVYSHEELKHKDSNQKQEMLFQKGINWNNYPASCKRGFYVQRKKILTPFTVEELESLPPKHHARLNPDLVMERSRIEVIEFPPLQTIDNREQLIFNS